MVLMLFSFFLSGIIWLTLGLRWEVLPLIFLPALLLLMRGYPGPERLGKPRGMVLFEPAGPVQSLPPLTREHLLWAYLVPALLGALLYLLFPLVALLLTQQLLSLALFITAVPLLYQLRRILGYLFFLLGKEVGA